MREKRTVSAFKKMYEGKHRSTGNISCCHFKIGIIFGILQLGENYTEIPCVTSMVQKLYHWCFHVYLYSFRFDESRKKERRIIKTWALGISLTAEREALKVEVLLSSLPPFFIFADKSTLAFVSTSSFPSSSSSTHCPTSVLLPPTHCLWYLFS